MSFFRVIYVYPAFRTEPLSYIGRTPEKKMSWLGAVALGKFQNYGDISAGS